jgi:general secretion pathway protein D
MMTGDFIESRHPDAYNQFMEQSSDTSQQRGRLRNGFDWFCAFSLFWTGSGLRATAQTDATGSRPAYSTSQIIEFQPVAETATIEIEQPNLQSIYLEIARSYGIELVLDRDLQEVSFRTPFRVRDATLAEALKIASTITHTFVAPLGERKGIVALDTVEKRGLFERQVLASFPIGVQMTPQQLGEISATLRNIVGLRRVMQDSRNHSIIVRGQSKQVAIANELIETLQQPHGEVLLKVSAFEVNSSRARKIGLQPSQAVLLSYLGRAVGQTKAPILAWGGGRTLYGLTLPGLLAVFRADSALVRSQTTMQLRATDSMEASLLEGERFPVLNSLLDSSISYEDPSLNTGAFFPQVQYEDIGFNLKVTPYLHAGREVTLALEITYTNVIALGSSGIPTFSNREATTQVRLGDGESYLIGGMLTHQETRTTNGWPWLGRIPLLGYLFSTRHVEQVETELVVAITPYILRPDPVEQFASRTIFFGEELTGLPDVVIPETPQE